MTEDAQRRLYKNRRFWLVLAVLAVLLAGLIVPPMVSISRYKSSITRLVSASLGRPVRLSSVELRLLPRPGFVLTDLTVEEDPAFGAEPVLHANTVIAVIRLLPLWRGRLEISTIDVDEASLNLVRTKEGRWNLDPFFHNATEQTHGAPQQSGLHLPYLEATDSRINIKNGLEKLPFSLMNADLSFWQENPGVWRVRLRGQPARTDVTLDLADTGIVDLEASLRSAPALRQMPIHLDMEWRKAQLGQLSRLVIGSDPGWRGDLTAELHLDGTAEKAQVKTRLRASGVHRAEFAPAAPLDFDANCGFAYRYSARSLDDLSCDSPLGDGHIKITGNLPGGAPPQLSVELQSIPVQAGLDLMRTLRSGFAEGLTAKGTITGKLIYDFPAPSGAPRPHPAPGKGHVKAYGATPAVTPAPVLSGSLVMEGFNLSGAGLSQPIQVAKSTLEPAQDADGQGTALTAAVTIPAGGSTPLAVDARLTLQGYLLGLHGPASLLRLREFAHVAGISDTSALDSITADPVALALAIHGPWLAPPELQLARVPLQSSDQITGSLTLRNAAWKSQDLASPVEITQATLHFGDTLQWDPVDFSYGPVKGTATLDLPPPCDAPESCPPRLGLQFGDLNAATLQEALLGARRSGTLLSGLLARFRGSSTPTWPQLDGTVSVNTLTLGPVRLLNAQASLQLRSTSAEITSLDAGLLGGKLHATGNVVPGDKPAYALEGTFSKVSSTALCQVMGLHCAGGTVEGNGKLELAGYSAADLGASAKGSMHFEWRRGAMHGPPPIPAPLARFDRWIADASIANGVLTLTQSRVESGPDASSVRATVTFAQPPKISFGVPESPRPTKR